MKFRLLAFGVSAVTLLESSSTTEGFSFSSMRSKVRSNGVASSRSASSFVGRSSLIQSRQSNRAALRSSNNGVNSMSMVIQQLSNDCISAIKVAHDLGNEVGSSECTKELLFAGIVRQPERARRTLESYDIDADEVKRAAITAMQRQPGTLSGFANESKEALPFAPETKLLLSKACTIAESMESTVTRSEHVLLALMGYNNGNKIQSSPVVDVLQKMTALSNEKRKFSVFNFCNDLVNSLPTIPYTEENVKKEAVVIGTSSGNTNTLSEVGVDMTQMALEGKFDAVYGRNDEIRSILRTLGRRRKNNPCLIGDPGVGKTAIAEALAQVLAQPIAEFEENKKMNYEMPQINIPNPFQQRVQAEQQVEVVEETVEEIMGYELPKCPAALTGFRLINVQLASLVAGTSNRGDFEKKVKSLIEEASNGKYILFIDEIHNLIGTGGGGDGAMNAANLLKPALARGELRVLGATTTPEYRRYIEKDGALERRFQPLEVKEPSVEETLDILASIFPKYEEYHGVEYTSQSLMAATKLSNRYISDRFLPDKAIDLLDEAGSMVKMSEDGENFYVTEDAITQVISEMTGIPLGKLDTGEKSRLQNLEEEMELRIKGQSQAVRSVAKSIRRARSGMRDMKRPVASFMFCGPTGVGKTEVCKALAATYYGQEKDMIRIDMSEYMDRFSTSRLLGAPPGYVGYEEGGQLTEAVRRKPHSVILFDELEKAHEDVLNLLLQIMDEGTLTDGKGRTVNFKNTILVMTSNIGSKDIINAAKDYSGTDVDEQKITADVVQGALEEALRPELLNRLDEIVVFNPLSYDNLKDISTNLVADAVKRAGDDLEINLKVSDNVAEMITRDAIKSASIYGARPIRRAVQRYVEDTMAETIVGGFIGEGDDVQLTLKGVKNEEDRRIVKITNLSANGSGVNTIEIPVDDDAGATALQESESEQAAYGDLPPMDDSPPKQEPDAFQ